jgi:uncharacterized protein involved in type VI secretion and phage assembly
MPDGALTYQGHIVIKLDGQEAPPELQPALLEVHVDSSLHLPDAATLILTDNETKWADHEKLMPGKTLEITVELEGGKSTVFNGEIVELEPAFEGKEQKVTVRAFDRLHRLTRGRYVRTFVQMTDSDIMQKVVQEVGLKPDIESTSEVYDHVFQCNQTNLEFLQARASALGRYLYAEGETIHCTAPKTESPLTLKLHEQLSEFRPRLTTSAQVSKVQVRGWNVKDKKEVLGEATRGSHVPKTGVPQSGGVLARNAHNVNAELLVNEPVVRTQGAAEKLAKAVADRLESRFIEAEGSASGDPKLLAGSTVKIEGVGTRFSGEYFVTSVTHRFAPAEGHTMSFSVSGFNPTNLVSLLSSEREFRAPSTIAVALVTDNNDPENLGRVKVKYPWLSDRDGSFWARVISVGGGKERGIMYTPEVDDEVLVGFEHGDIDQPYVLGGLWNGKDAPPLPSSQAVKSGSTDQRIIKSRTGHVIILNDSSDKPGIKILDKTGKNLVEIDSTTNALKIEMDGDTTITAKGKIKIESKQGIEMTAATDIKIKGSSGVNVDGGPSVDVKGVNLNLKGDAMAKLDGGGMTEIKGGLVKIN